MKPGPWIPILKQAWGHLAKWPVARFPLVILAALAGTAAALRLNHLPLHMPEARDEAARLLLTCWLGVSLLFALALVSEGRRLHRGFAWGLQAAGLGLLIAYHLALGDSPHPVRMTRFWLFMASSHLFMVLAPALAKGATESSFWHFNLRLLARASHSLLHAGLLLLGVTVALGAVKTLFELPLPDNVFLDPVIAIWGIFFTWFFLSGAPLPESGSAPAGSGAPASLSGYPLPLRRASQFILMPLMTVYLLILYVYALKVLVTWRWPTGGASWLILAFCGLGLVTLFLIQPLEKDAPEGPGRPGGGPQGWEAKWFRFFGRYFYPALIPLLALLFTAIGRRIYDYGLTENRYLVLALAVWLSGIALHAVIDRRRDIRILPASLGLVSLLAAFGPWGAFEVSRKSQLQRLGGFLESNGMLVGGKLAKAPGPVPREVKREIAGIAHYLEERRRLGDLTPWLPSLDDTVRTHPVVWFGALENKFALLQALELPYVPPAGGAGSAGSEIAFLCRACDHPMKRVSGYDLLYVDFRSEAESEGRELPSADPDGLPGLRFAFEPDSGLLRFSARHPSPDSDQDTTVLDLDLGAYFQGLRERYPDAYDLNLPEEEMVLEQEADRLKVRLRLRSLRGDMADEEEARLKGFAADVLVQVKSRRRGRP